MTETTLFEKIIAKQIPATIIHEDDLCIAFEDITPAAPVHILIVPKKVIPKLSDVSPEDQALLGHLMLTASQLAKKLDIAEGFRVVINNGESACQSVFHLHLHLLGKRTFSWPPG